MSADHPSPGDQYDEAGSAQTSDGINANHTSDGTGAEHGTSGSHGTGATPPTVRPPTRRDRFRPLELLLISGIVAVFVGLIVLLSTRSAQLAFVFGGIAFIASLMLLAMLALTAKPTGEERTDLDEQNRGH